MVMNTNIQHFMDGDEVAGDLPAEATALLNFLTAIIEAATKVYDETHPTAIASTCRNIINVEQCDGDVVVWVSKEDDQIGWGCTDCDDEGIITHWEGTKWDNRKFTRH